MELLEFILIVLVGLVSLLLPAGPMFTGAEESRRERRRRRYKKNR